MANELVISLDVLTQTGLSVDALLYSGTTLAYTIQLSESPASSGRYSNAGVVGAAAGSYDVAFVDRTTGELYGVETSTFEWTGTARNTITGVLTDTAAILLDTGTDGVVVNTFTVAGKAEVQQEATDAINAYDPPTNAELEARTLITASYATAANQTTILARLGAWTGTARNTILGALQALFRSDADATVPSDINADLGSGVGTATNTTDSTQAIRDSVGSPLQSTDVRLDNLDAPVSTAVTPAAAAAADASAIATILTGITSLANWLRLLGRASTADATAKTEFNLTGGVYDEAIHSLQAIVAELDSLSASELADTSAAVQQLREDLAPLIGLDGLVSVDLVIRDGASNPVTGATVVISSDITGDVPLVTNKTGADGQVTVFLSPGTYYRWAQHPKIRFTNPFQFIVPA